MVRIFLVILIYLICVDVHAQKDSFVQSNVDSSLVWVLNDLEQRYGWHFSFMHSDVAGKQLQQNIEASELTSFLDELCSQLELDYKVMEGDYITLSSLPPERTICGYVMDGLSGTPLAFANVYLSKRSKGVETDEEGYFSLSTNMDLNDPVEISYVGYQEKLLPVTQLIGDECRTIHISIDESLSPYLLITDYLLDGINLTDNGLATEIKINKIEILPGMVSPDVLGVTQFMPGVSPPSSKASDIYIRGATPDQTLIMWDEIPIYHSAHYFGVIPAFNPFTIDKLTVYRGGFGPEYRDRVGGILKMEAMKMRDEGVIGVYSDLTHASIYGRQIIGNKKKGSLNWSLRRSFQDLWESPTAKSYSNFNQQGLLIGDTDLISLPDYVTSSTDFRFLDGHLSYEQQLSDHDVLEVSGLYNTNYFDGLIDDTQRQESQRDSFYLQSFGLKTALSHHWSPRLKSKFGSVYSDYLYEYEFTLEDYERDRIRSRGTKENSLKDFQFFTNVNYQGVKNQILEAGYQYTAQEVSFSVDERRSGRSSDDSRGRSDSGLHSIYAKFSNPIRNKIGLDAGVRASFFNLTRQWYLSPRLRLSYAINDIISISANASRHHQFLGQVIDFKGSENGISLPLWALAEDTSIPIQSSNLYQCGFLFDHHGWNLDFQLYRRDVSGISSRAFEIELSEGDNMSVGKAESRGIDFLLKKRFSSFQLWLSYALSDTNYSFPGSSELRNFAADHDMRHVLSFNQLYSFHNFNVACGVKYHTGLPYSRLIEFQNNQGPGDSDDYDLFYDGVNNYRLDNVWELNVSAQYHLSLPSNDYQIWFSGSVQNVLNNNNVFERSYYLETTMNNQSSIEYFEKVNFRFTPNFSVRLEF